MRFTYHESDNSTSDATSLESQGIDVLVKKVIFGNPTDGDVFRFYNSSVAQGHASGIASVPDDNLAFEHVQATHAAGCPWTLVLDFTGEGNPGLQLDGGSFHSDGDNITVIWERADQVS